MQRFRRFGSRLAIGAVLACAGTLGLSGTANAMPANYCADLLHRAEDRTDWAGIWTDLAAVYFSLGQNDAARDALAQAESLLAAADSYMTRYESSC
jgi:Flp pilus assembly protein TadD